MIQNKEETLSKDDLSRAATIISALNSPLRTQIILMLAEGPLYVHQIVTSLDQSQPLVSQHLRVLKQAGIVAPTRKGKQVIYRLIRTDIPALISWVAGHNPGPDGGTELSGRQPGEVDELADRRAKKESSAESTEASGGENALGAAAIVRPHAVMDTIPNPSPRPVPGMSPMDPS
ncbi:metalloregulator ArsR/SmtB family transcription factor [Corynebacterium uropygiale]|uniref:Metalloregulator ArsR/SmtB family transcription factor n=1 Tax=Corynebacterium uropygiale TaxID=1775911 RepID=A0A9X1QPS5_9CORY|nr:metalloregulator ArsR/SmtB family transcription factor [Corynebacterium uropygiale]